MLYSVFIKKTLHSFASNSSRKSTSSWFSKTTSQPENAVKQRKEEDTTEGDETVSEAGSSESQRDQLDGKREKTSDEDEKKQTGTEEAKMDTNGKVRICLFTGKSGWKVQSNSVLRTPV